MYVPDHRIAKELDLIYRLKEADEAIGAAYEPLNDLNNGVAALVKEARQQVCAVRRLLMERLGETVWRQAQPKTVGEGEETP